MASAAPAPCGSTGVIVRACLVLAVQADGLAVETIEGVSESGEAADLQAEFARAQCAAMRLLHAGDGAGGARSAAPTAACRAATRSASTCPAITAAAPAIRRSSTRWRRRRRPRRTARHGLSPLDRPDSYIGRADAAARTWRGSPRGAAATPATSCCRACCTSRSCARRMRMRASCGWTLAAARARPGVAAVVTGRRPRGGLHALGRRAGAPDRAEIGAAAPARDRVARWQGEPVAAVAAAHPGAGGRRGWSTSRSSGRNCPPSSIARDRAGRRPPIHAALGDNLAFERKLDAGAVDAAFAEADAGGRGAAPVRPAYRRHARGARDRRRLEPRASSG